MEMAKQKNYGNSLLLKDSYKYGKKQIKLIRVGYLAFMQTVLGASPPNLSL